MIEAITNKLRVIATSKARKVYMCKQNIKRFQFKLIPLALRRIRLQHDRIQPKDEIFFDLTGRLGTTWQSCRSTLWADWEHLGSPSSAGRSGTPAFHYRGRRCGSSQGRLPPQSTLLLPRFEWRHSALSYSWSPLSSSQNATPTRSQTPRLSYPHFNELLSFSS